MKNNSLIITLTLFVNIAFGEILPSIKTSLKKARLLEKTGEIDSAISLYEGILVTNPENRQSIQKLKSLFLNFQRYEKGIQFYRARLSLKPNDITNYSELGQLHYLNGQKKEAKIVWNAGLNKFKHNRSYYRTMISILGKHSLDDELKKILDKGKIIFGKSFLSYESGIYYQTRRVYDKAMEQFILYLLHESNQNGIIERRILLMSDEDEALEIIENQLIEASKNDPEKTLNVLSEFYFKQQDYKKSFITKEQWTTAGKKDFNEWIRFANDLRKEGQYRYSIDAYNFILSHKLNPNITSKALLGLANTFEDQIIPADDNHLIPYFFDHSIFFEDPFGVYTSISSDNLKSSLAVYDSLLVSSNKSPLIAEAYFRIGNIQYKILQDFDQAYYLFNKALNNRPNNILRLKIVLRISDVLLALGKGEEAIGFLQRESKRNPHTLIEQKSILILFLTKDPDSTIQNVETAFLSLSPLDPSFNDLMELKNILTKYYNNNEIDKSAFQYFQKSEFYLRQKKIGDAIKELDYLHQEYPTAKIVSLIKLRLALLHYRLRTYDKALQFALSLNGTEFNDEGIILAGQIYELKLHSPEKALEQYMKILNEFPSSIYTEPVRYHIRKLQQIES